jgi:diguanylate cyclase (GGDEF)-like protein/PAS domain S-box-containing protein
MPFQKPFLSISWKVTLVAGVALMLSTAIYTWHIIDNAARHDEHERSRHRTQDVDLVNQLIRYQAGRLESLGALIAAFPNLRLALQSGDQKSLQQAFIPFWSDLNLSHDLEALSFVGADGSLLGRWGEKVAGGSHQHLLARDAIQAERPMSVLACEEQCSYLMAIPMLEQGRVIGATVIASSLEDFILKFRQLTGDEIALLKAPSLAGVSSQPGHGMRPLVVSGGAFYAELVRDIQPGQLRSDGFDLSRDGRYFHAFLAPVPSSYMGSVQMLVLEDITSEALFQREELRSHLLWSLVTLFFLLSGLYLLLSLTMGRVRRAAQSLPMLGEGRFGVLREALEDWQPKLMRDEMDDLVGHALTLADTLEQLQAEARHHARAIEAQAGATARERDFISGLLETAPVIILTYGDDERIRLANAQAALVSGRPARELAGKSFVQLFIDARQHPGHLVTMATLRPGEVKASEGVVVRPDGDAREVVWFHSCVVGEGQDRTFLSVGLDVTEHHQMERRLLFLAERDNLTGLYNRHAFKRELDALLLAGAGGLLLVCDLDEFKQVNDQLGTEASDNLLVECARHLLRTEPAPALAARLGSDEFGLVYTDLNAADGIALARRFNQFMPLLPVGSEGGPRHHLSACVGLVLFPEHSADAGTLLGHAEIALTNARAKGHGSWHLYSPDDTQRQSAGRRSHWRAEIEAALEENRLVLYFQPIVRIADGRVSHHEVLLRMIGREGELIAPGLFIDVAESTGLIRRIDRWVIEETVAVVARRPEATLALNLSSRSFDDDLAFEAMQSALARFGVAGNRLLLEITETATLANIGSATRIIERMRGLGCSFGLDDFGVGYSSFQYLKELPVDFVKIDGSFIKNLTRNPDDIVFVKALNEAVKGFGKVTVAEFVEDQESLAILREIGVDYAQGYLLGRPGPELS